MLRRRSEGPSAFAREAGARGGGQPSGAADRYLICVLAGVEYGISADQVEHSLAAPGAPGSEVTFVGRAYPVVDLRTLFGLPPFTGRRRFVVLVDADGRHGGLLVDSIQGLVQLDPATMVPLPPAFAGAERGWFRAITVLEGKIVTLLRLDRVLARQEMAGPSQAAAQAPAGVS